MKHTIQNRTQQVARRKGEKYTLSPFKMLISDGNYYLLAYDSNYKKILTFRIDRMKGVEELQEMREGEEEYKKIDIDSYNQRVFSMFGGNETNVKLRFANDLSGVVFDKFGMDIPVIPDGSDYFICNVNILVSPLFFSWLAGFGNKVKILSPQNVIDDFKKLIYEISENYKGE